MIILVIWRHPNWLVRCGRLPNDGHGQIVVPSRPEMFIAFQPLFTNLARVKQPLRCQRSELIVIVDSSDYKCPEKIMGFRPRDPGHIIFGKAQELCPFMLRARGSRRRQQYVKEGGVRQDYNVSWLWRAPNCLQAAVRSCSFVAGLSNDMVWDVLKQLAGFEDVYGFRLVCEVNANFDGLEFP